MAPLPGFSFPSGSSKRPSTGTPKAPPSSSSSSARFNPDTDILQLESASSSKGKGGLLGQQSTLKALPSHGSTGTMSQLLLLPANDSVQGQRQTYRHQSSLCPTLPRPRNPGSRALRRKELSEVLRASLRSLQAPNRQERQTLR